MKLNELEQKELDHIRQNASRYGNVGGGNFENPKTRDDKRTRKLLDNGVILYVGCGTRTEDGWMGGAGLIPTDMFDESKHTKLSVCRESKVEVTEDKSLAISLQGYTPITVYKVILDGDTIAECRDKYWADYLANAIKKGKL